MNEGVEAFDEIWQKVGLCIVYDDDLILCPSIEFCKNEITKNNTYKLL